MSTPKNPGPRLPDKPVRPPTVSQEAPAATLSPDTASVLERLKAARPRTAAVADHDDARPPTANPGSGGGRPGGSGDGAATAANTRTSGGAGSTPTSGGAGSTPTSGGAGSTPKSGGAGSTPKSGGADSTPKSGGAVISAGGNDAGTRSTDATVTAASSGAVGGQGSQGSQGSQGGKGSQGNKGSKGGNTGPAAAERLRVAAARTRAAASVTGTVINRGSTATVRHVSSWDADVVRQVVVTICAVVCILGSAAGVGAFGGPSIRDAAGGLFAPDATLLAPSSVAFSIWSVIYVGLVAYTAFQWLPSQRRSARQRSLGWTVAASMILNLAWILSAQAGRLTLSLVVIMLLFFALLAAVHTMNDHPTETRLEGALVDVPIGLYLGWVLLAAAANWAAFLTDREADLFGWSGVAWSILGISAVLVTAAVICSTDRGRLSVAVATSWGLLWIAVERVIGQPVAINLAFFAALAIFLLLITAGSRRHRVDHEYRHWLRAQQDAQREPVHLLGDDYEDSRY